MKSTEAAQASTMSWVEIALQADGTLHMRIPGKGARWRKGFRNIDEAVKEALKELPQPFEIDYVQPEETGHPWRQVSSM